ncbi:MAG TPA: hypothetical protein VJY36_03785 [Candidatus Bathyarchaeia archaeon]|nr:hypothetical protein [Candidatus Bathyarchaeia archaeon]
MTQENTEAQHAQKREPLTDSVTAGCSAITAQSRKQKMPLRKRKKEAKKTLYLNRI